jgi:hypothetical protein
MTKQKLELTIGAISIAVGIVGIILSVLTLPAPLDALAAFFNSNNLPDDFRTSSGRFLLASIIGILVVTWFAILVGVTVLIGYVYAQLGAYRPRVLASIHTFGLVLIVVGLLQMIVRTDDLGGTTVALGLASFPISLLTNVRG